MLSGGFLGLAYRFFFFFLLYTGGTYATVRVTLFRTFVSVVYIFTFFFILLGLDGWSSLGALWGLGREGGMVWVQRVLDNTTILFFFNCFFSH